MSFLVSDESIENILYGLSERMEDVLDEFGLEYEIYDNRICTNCEIHGGDKKEALVVYTNNDLGIWKCYTAECHETYGKDGIGLIRGLLSVEKSKEISRFDAIKWAANFLGESINYEENKNFKDQRNYTKMAKALLKTNKTTTVQIKREQAIKSLRIPATFYVRQGFSKKILTKYDVGYCATAGKEMFDRVVFPVYDDMHEHIVGVVGRTIQPYCKKCKKYHYTNRHCPTNRVEELWASKWRNSKGFRAESFFFNYWFAAKHIKQCGCAILVEGQGDVLRLEEAGIKIALGMFGTSITDDQLMLLEKSGATTLVIFTDNDNAGKKAREDIKEKCGLCFNIITEDLPKKDFGIMKVAETRTFVNPILKRIGVSNALGIHC